MKNLALLSCFLFLLSCSGSLDQSAKDIDPTNTVQYAGKYFDISKKEDLIEVALIIAKETEVLNPEVIECKFQEFTPLKGDKFKGFKAIYRSGDSYITAVTPVETATITNKGGRAMMMKPKCTMSCNASTFCQGCDMTINEECKSLSCSCNKGNGDCTPEVTVPQTSE